MNPTTTAARHDAARVLSVSPFPPGALATVGIVLAALLVMVAGVRLSGVDIREPDAPAARVLALRFEDRPDGSVAVIDAASGRLLQSVVGEAGFLRGTLRGLARERRRVGLGQQQPFELIGRTDGRLTLLDPATGQRVDLESFGPTNAAVFVDILALGTRLPRAAAAARSSGTVVGTPTTSGTAAAAGSTAVPRAAATAAHANAAAPAGT